jgi:hypothetical protein
MERFECSEPLWGTLGKVQPQRHVIAILYFNFDYNFYAETPFSTGCTIQVHSIIMQESKKAS